MSQRYSLIANASPSFLRTPDTSALSWLRAKQLDDNAEGLWRIHDKLYDFTRFIDAHPGGSDWLTLTKGTDITEAFEVHHINASKIEILQKKFEVRTASKPRNIQLTFNKNGFYRTLKVRVAEKLKTIDRKPEIKSKIISDLLFISVFVFATLSIRFHSFLVAAVTSLLLAWTLISAHNFFHRRDNFRMLYFNLGFMSYKEWRISHALSHHLYPNSLQDLELLLVEPFLVWVPSSEMKGFTQRYLSWVYSPIIWGFFFYVELGRRVHFIIQSKDKVIFIEDLLPFTLPALMYIFGNAPFFYIFKMWMFIIYGSSFIFQLIALHAGHHHPEVVHDGDPIRPDLDWGLYTLDAVIDRKDLRGNKFLVLTNFGDHALHHLFPTLDHGILEQLYPILFNTIDEFECDLRAYPWYKLIIGQYQQLARIKVIGKP